ncbi:MAG: hypothetical protein IJ733_02750 [Lachnospiraceae bacterium]|nr:hypothetical protein [Lachnospiraceae bacterium]
MKHIREVLQLLAVLTNDNRFLTVAEKARKGEIMLGNMSTALDQIEKHGFHNGFNNGFSNGFARAKRNWDSSLTFF